MPSDALGDRMKMYEMVPRTRLVRRLPVVMRLDGKAFHTFTRKMERPYDERFQGAMWAAARHLCEEIQGCRVAYVQSDEISLLLTDWDSFGTDSWFDYQVQKMVSVAASICTGGFLRGLALHGIGIDLMFDGSNIPAFDARVWNLPRHEVVNYFLWRQQDASRNSILSLGQAHFSHKQLHGKNTSQVQDMLVLERQINWNDCPVPQKRGVCIVKETFEVPGGDGVDSATRTRWVIDEDIPIFSQDRSYIERHLTEPFWKENV